MAAFGPVTKTAWGKINELSHRIEACEDVLGKPGDAGEKKENEPGITSSLTTLAADVEAVFNKEEAKADLQAFEQKIATLDDALAKDCADTNYVLYHKLAKRQYLAQHAGQVEVLGQILKEVKDLEKYSDAAQSEGKEFVSKLPEHRDALRANECGLSRTYLQAQALSNHMGTTATQWYKTVNALNEQLVLWDRMLDAPVKGAA
eukprot:TRINITY_DN122761_c0_g1_i1.p1 TRINITY_DN122761_c0_g1~~TRINITY_DN122761_c0_g1_i1.p1  ORF type:complete len:204 (+),score=46.09 TRINITY_DN122761_c0_g1_i1:72-683(+)